MFEDIKKEAEVLSQAGHQELVLTGINLGTYEHEGKTIMDVIRMLEEITLVKRIRISSIEPTTVPKELIEHMTHSKKLCRYLHIPLQSGSDNILSAMKRLYTLKEFNDFIEFAHKTVPEICIGTDVIVGFPGETQEEFEKTYEYLRDSAVHYFHVFSYSDREHAKSPKLENKIPLQMIQARSQSLRELSARKRNLFYSSLRDISMDVLFENQKNGNWSGLTGNFIRVTVKSDEVLTNQIRKVRFTQAVAEEMQAVLI